MRDDTILFTNLLIYFWKKEMEQIRSELLKKIAEDLAKQFKIDSEKVLGVLRKHFSLKEKLPVDTFRS